MFTAQPCPSTPVSPRWPGGQGLPRAARCGPSQSVVLCTPDSSVLQATTQLFPGSACHGASLLLYSSNSEYSSPGIGARTYPLLPIELLLTSSPCSCCAFWRERGSLLWLTSAFLYSWLAQRGTRDLSLNCQATCPHPNYSIRYAGLHELCGLPDYLINSLRTGEGSLKQLTNVHSFLQDS